MIKACVIIPGSKSITNRALLLAALSKGISEIQNVLIGDDTSAFMQALRDMGIMIQLDEENQSCRVVGQGGFFQKESTVWCEGAGTAARFLLAASASFPGIYHFDANHQLRRRPIEPLLEVLQKQGAHIVPEHAAHFPLTIQGTNGLLGGQIEMDNSQTGQFISALLMAAPFAKSPFILNVAKSVSRPYIDMTAAMMAEFGVSVEHQTSDVFSVSIPQTYQATTYIVEPDFSTASYFFAAAAVTGGEVIIQPVDIQRSKQADVAFLSVLEKMGCTIENRASGLCVKGPEILRGITVDMSDFPDTFMTLAAIAPYAKTPTYITHIEHARFKESDRMTAMREGLEKLSVKLEEGRDWMKIYPSMPHAGIVKSYQDHRIAMSFSVMKLRTPDIIIEDAECVSKTCPNFFKLWDAFR